jgi:hypothetical protein
VTWPLTALEQVHAGLDAWPVEVLLVFGAALDPDALRVGLDRLRPDFPWLWGRVGAEEIVADDRPILHVLAGPDDIVKGPPPIDAAAVLEAAISPSSAILRARLHPAIADATSFFAFLEAWARASRGLAWERPSRELGPFVTDLPEVEWTPAHLRDALGATWTPGILRRDPGVSSIEVEPVRPDTLGRALEGVTAPDLVAGWAWKRCGLRWSAPDETRPLTVPVDLRGRLPGLAPSHFGHATAHTVLDIDRDALELAPVPWLARRVWAARDRYGADRARDAVAAAAAFTASLGHAAWDEVHLVDPAHGVLVLDLTDASPARFDFGAGPPAGAHPFHRYPRLALALPGDDGHVDVHVHHPRPLPPPRTGQAEVLRFRTS